MKLIKLIDSLVEKFSAYLLVGSILSILLFSSLSIILRWIHINLSWIDPFIRHLVFLGTFLGGVVATGRGNHIGIDIISKFLEIKGYHRAQRYIGIIINLFSFLVLLWLIKASVMFTKVEMEFSRKEFFGIDSGYLVAIIPIGVGLIAIRYLALFILSFDQTYAAKKTIEAKI
jgi:TRAP-type C4-dicarboxylate transport system permease small subunit